MFFSFIFFKISPTLDLNPVSREILQTNEMDAKNAQAEFVAICELQNLLSHVELEPTILGQGRGDVVTAQATRLKVRAVICSDSIILRSRHKHFDAKFIVCVKTSTRTVSNCLPLINFS